MRRHSPFRTQVSPMTILCSRSATPASTPTRFACWLALTLCTAACGSDGSDDPAYLLHDNKVVYPVPDWSSAEPQALGFDAQKLEALAEVASENGSHCLLVTRKG